MDKAHYRNLRIDAMKTLSSIFVVYIHASNLYGYSQSNNVFVFNVYTFFGIINSTAVPIFFVISGFFTAKGYVQTFSWYKNNIKKKIKSLLVPYFLWITIYFFLEHILTGDLSSITITNIVEDFIGIPFGEAPIYNPLWFIRDLFLVTFLVPVIYLATKKYVSIIFCIAIWYSCFSYQFKEVFTWYIIGIIIFKYKSQFIKLKQWIIEKKIITLIILVVTISGMIMMVILNNIILIDNLKDTLVIFWVGLIALFFSQVNINENEICNFLNRYISKSSFIIFACHGKLLTIMQIMWVRIFGNNMIGLIVAYFLLPAFTICICIGINNVLQNKKIYAILTGNRVINTF